MKNIELTIRALTPPKYTLNDDCERDECNEKCPYRMGSTLCALYGDPVKTKDLSKPFDLDKGIDEIGGGDGSEDAYGIRSNTDSGHGNWRLPSLPIRRPGLQLYFR